MLDAEGGAMIIPKWLEQVCVGPLEWLGLIVVICMFCRRFIAIGRARGARGGFSHGMCSPLCDEAEKCGWK